jgi:hypothetical protein
MYEISIWWMSRYKEKVVCFLIENFIEFIGNDNNFMTHDECEAMCDELIQDHKSSI